MTFEYRVLVNDDDGCIFTTAWSIKTHAQNVYEKLTRALPDALVGLQVRPFGTVSTVKDTQ